MITNNASDFDKGLQQYADKLKSISESGVNDDDFQSALKLGSKVLEDSLQLNYLKADPSGMGGRVSINVGIYKTKGTNKTKSYFIIGPGYKNSKGWQVWHLLNYGFVHALGKVTKTKSGKVITKSKAGSTTTIIQGKHFLQNTQQQSGNEALKVVEEKVFKILSNINK